MDSAKFNYIRTIAECKSISKASQKLHISQPALTRYVNKLEDELGVKLLDRTTLPIKLTYAGEWYIKRVQQILDINSCMQKELQEIVNLERGRLKIGMSPGRLDHWAPHLLPEFIAAFPQVDVQFITGSHDFLENSVLNGSLDFAVLPLPLHSSRLSYTLIVTERMVFAVPPAHPLLADKQVTDDTLAHPILLNPEELNGETFLIVPSDHGIFKILEETLNRHHIRPGRYMEFPDSNLTYKLACENIGITFIQDTTAVYPGYYKKACFCTLDDPPVKSCIVAAYRSDIGLSPLSSCFLDIALKIAETSPFLQIKEKPCSEI